MVEILVFLSYAEGTGNRIPRNMGPRHNLYMPKHTHTHITGINNLFNPIHNNIKLRLAVLQIRKLLLQFAQSTPAQPDNFFISSQGVYLILPPLITSVFLERGWTNCRSYKMHVPQFAFVVRIACVFYFAVSHTYTNIEFPTQYERRIELCLLLMLNTHNISV